MGWSFTTIPFSTLDGAVIHKVTGLERGNDEVFFHTSIGVFKMYHSQDCCESVSIEDVVGSVDDLQNATVVFAREDDGEVDGDEHDHYESCTWTFYNIQTDKGHVQIRWLGTSNGYYSESVYFVKVSEDGSYGY